MFIFIITFKGASHGRAYLHGPPHNPLNSSQGSFTRWSELLDAQLTGFDTFEPSLLDFSPFAPIPQSSMADEKITPRLHPEESPYVEPFEKLEEVETKDDLLEQTDTSSSANRYSDSRRSSRQFAPINPSDREQLRGLARSLSRTYSSKTTLDLQRLETITGLADSDPVFDPNNQNFDLYKWIKKFIRNLDEEQVKQKRAGIVFKNLNVSGTGSALNLQQTVSSFLMAPFRIREFIDLGHKPSKRILKDFDGVLKSGEMLIVLGRPGSGCSTLLKSMCGELHGLQVDDNSVVHYNGRLSMYGLKFHVLLNNDQGLRKNR